MRRSRETSNDLCIPKTNPRDYTRVADYVGYISSTITQLGSQNLRIFSFLDMVIVNSLILSLA